MGDIELIWTDPNNAGPNGTSIAGAKVPDVLVGQYINPTVDVIAPADVLYILWDAPPGRTFDRWDESADFKTANLVPGPSSLLLGTDSPHWVWADPGDNRAITVNVETSGSAYSLTTHVNVKAPTVSSGTSIGEAEFVPTHRTACGTSLSQAHGLISCTLRRFRRRRDLRRETGSSYNSPATTGARR